MDSHRLHPDHAPTPFSADEIRDATPVGHTVETVTEHDGAIVARQRTVFTEVDGERAVMVSTPIDESGEPVGAPRTGAAAWTELQAHASFPEATTTISDETIETPLGTVRCRRYDVRGGDHTNTFWFAPAHPGMPVRFTSSSEHGPTTTVVSISRST